MEKTLPVQVRLNSFSDLKLYLISSLFVIGNVAFPYLLHKIGIAGPIFLPLYFFSLVGGLMFGWRCGLVSGTVSPVVSFLASGMPPMMILPFVILKSILLGFTGGYLMADSMRKIDFYKKAALAVLISQFIGTMAIYLFTGKSQIALSDLTTGIPGLMIQIVVAPAIAGVFYGKKTTS